MSPGGASMVLATFAETKVARRAGAKPRIVIRDGMSDIRFSFLPESGFVGNYRCCSVLFHHN